MRKGPETAVHAVEEALRATEDVLQRQAKKEPSNKKALLSRLETATRAVEQWRAVRRQRFWDRGRPNLREGLAHSV
jgi:hypothetical protein